MTFAVLWQILLPLPVLGMCWVLRVLRPSQMLSRTRCFAGLRVLRLPPVLLR